MFDFFWSEWFWLPPGFTWSDLEKQDDDNKRRLSDVFIYPFFIAAALFVFRNYFLIPYISVPIAKKYKVRSKPYSHPEPNDRLDKLYAVNRARPPKHMLSQYSNEIGWTERKVERWLRQKALSQQMTTLEKFNDHCWQFTYYLFYFIFGCNVIVPKNWFWEPMRAMDNYPFQDVSSGLWWHYMTFTAFYIVQMILLLQHDRRHDFRMMIAHHIIAVIGGYINWIMSIHTVTALAVFYHEIPDMFLSLGKMFFYSGRPNISDWTALPFFLIWVPTRLYLFPYNVIYLSQKLPQTFGLWPNYCIAYASVVVLLILHIIWTYQMTPVFIQKLLTNDSVIDPRSSGEELSDEDNKENNLKTKHGIATGNMGSARKDL